MLTARALAHQKQVGQLPSCNPDYHVNESTEKQSIDGDGDEFNNVSLDSQLSVAQFLARKFLASRLCSVVLLLCIIATSALAGIETYARMSEYYVIKVLDIFILAIFGVELLLRIFCEIPHVWRFWIGQSWIANWFDFMIVVLGVISLNQYVVSSGVSLLPLMRLLRLTKLVRKVPQMQQILTGLAGGMKSGAYIILLLFLVLYIYAIIAIHSFKENNPWHYRNLPNALLSLFRAATLVDWARIMYIDVLGCHKDSFIYSRSSNVPGLESWWYCTKPEPSYLVAPLFYISFIVLSSLVMLSLFVGSITLSMSGSIQQMKREEQDRLARLTLRKKVGILITEGKSTKGKSSDGKGDENRQHQEQIPKSSSIHTTSRRSSVTEFLGLELSTHEKVKARQRLHSLLRIAWGGNPSHEDLDELSTMFKQFEGSGLRRSYWLLSLRCRHITATSTFHYLSTTMIFFAGVLVGIQTNESVMTNFPLYIQIADAVVLAAFTFEISLKVLAEGFYPARFFFPTNQLFKISWWNVFDFFIVLGNYALLLTENKGEQKLLSMLRLVRLLRVFRVVTKFPELQVIVEALITGIKSIGYIGGLLLLVIYAFGIFATTTFGSNDPFNFGSLHISILTLFRLSTLEGWSDVMYINMYGCDRFGYDNIPEECVNPTPNGWLAAFYFILFVTISSMVLLTLFVSVVTTSMEEAKQQQTEARLSAARIKELNLSESSLKSFRAAFDILDLDGSGAIDEEELLIGLQSIGCNPTPDELRDMMEAADIDNSGRIDFLEFLMVMSSERLRKANIVDVSDVESADDISSIHELPHNDSTILSNVPDCVGGPNVQEVCQKRQVSWKSAGAAMKISSCAKVVPIDD